MRPTDENQYGSTRPNLLSGGRRRFGGDDNILERLERDSARQASGNRSRAAWYAVAASLILLLIVVLAWMAYDNASTVHVIPMTRAPADDVAATAPPRDPPPVTAPSAAQAPALPAMLRDVAPEQATAPPPAHAADALPPLVLLRDHETPPRAAKPPAKAADPAPPPVAAPAPTAIPSRPPARVSVPAPPVLAAARAPARPAAATRTRKAGADSAPPETTVDTDVALLSAIIIHDSTHAGEKAQLEASAACVRGGAKKCPGRPGAGP